MHCGVVIADKKDQQGPSEQELEELWDTVSSDLSSIFQGRGPALPTDVTPFDAASDVDIDQQMYVHVAVHCCMLKARRWLVSTASAQLQRSLLGPEVMMTASSTAGDG